MSTPYQPGPHQPPSQQPGPYQPGPHASRHSQPPRPYGGGASAGPPPQGPPAKRNWIPIIVVAIIAVTALVVGIIVATGGSSADATDYGLTAAKQRAAPDVSQLAADAVKAADDVDVDAGLALMCQMPSSKQVIDLKKMIAEADSKAGGTAKKTITIEDAEQSGSTGSFAVRVDGQEALKGYGFTGTAEVKKSGDRWCISTFDLETN